MLVAAITAAAAWAATTWLLSVAGDNASLRVEAIKAGLTVAAGTGGAAALLLAARRQWLHEREQIHREETDAAAQAHQQRLAVGAELDATERRITELYTKAVDQIGSDKAPVRLGGLYALERLAQDNLGHRQTIVNVICAYLRMPYNSPPEIKPVTTGILPEDQPRAREELQVRRAAQRILAAHLRPGQPAIDGHQQEPASFWDHISIDLTGAILIDFDLSDCTIGEADFRQATFKGPATFSRATFTGNADFRDAAFTGGTWFTSSTFNSDSWFDQATFATEVYFPEVTFDGTAYMNGVMFSSDALFNTAFFADGAYFGRATFTGKTDFGNVTFTDMAFFGRATFTGNADFSNVTFTGNATFRETTMAGDTEFHGATFTPTADTRPPPAWPPGWSTNPGPANTGHLVRNPSPANAGEQHRPVTNPPARQRPNQVTEN